MAVKVELERAVKDILKADSDFDTIEVWCIGVLYLVPLNWFPLVEVYIQTRAEGEHETQYHRYLYGGTAAFSVQAPDHPELVSGEVEVESHVQVAEYADAAKTLLLADMTLGGFVSADGKERVDCVDASVPRYLIAPSRGRLNNLENVAEVDFVLHTRRQLW